ncbi:MAG: metallophosphoesterase, partial [Acidimicrobiia bacterium]|nr:metallophosphoesterase [Acidimicrobiia bacterium]
MRRGKLLIVAIVVAMFIPAAALAKPPAAPVVDDVVEITLLHTNDFHGRLETDYAFRGGSAYLADAVNDVRAEVGSGNVALLDAGDVYFAAPAISQLLMGESTIDIYNMMGYDVATFGNHEFDKGQDALMARVAQSDFPWLGANVVLEGTDWDLPDWAEPYTLLDVGGITLGVLGLAGEETPEVTLLGTTAGLVFKDLTDTILHYYDDVMAEADAMVVLVHMGTEDSGPYDGLKTVAQALIDAGKPVDLMIGGHQHQALFEPIIVGDTTIVAAGYYGRWLGRVDIAVDPSTKSLSIVDYELMTITGGPMIGDLLASVTEMYDEGLIAPAGVYNSLIKKLESALKSLDKGQYKTAMNKLGAFINEVEARSGKRIDPDAAVALIAGAESIVNDVDFDVAARVADWAEIVAPIVNEPVVESNIELTRDYNAESLIGDIVTDSMLWKADEYDDGEVNGSVDIAFTNPGGLRADILNPGGTYPFTVTWGNTFD